MNDDSVIVRYLKSEDRCQVIFDKLILSLDKEYKDFLDRKAPYNKRVIKNYGVDDSNWETFCKNAERMGMEAVEKMGVGDYDIENMGYVFEDVEGKRELNNLIKRYKKDYNNVIPEVFNLVYRISFGWSEKYVYVWNEKSLHTRPGVAQKEKPIPAKVKNVQPYIDEISAGLTDEALDALYDKGEDALVSDEQLSLLFYPKFKEDEECEYPEAGEFALRYNEKKEEMVLFSNYEAEVLWSVKCDIDNVQSIISCAIECINHCIQENI